MTLSMGFILGVILSPLIFMASVFFTGILINSYKYNGAVATFFVSLIIGGHVWALVIGVWATLAGKLHPGSLEIITAIVIIAGAITSFIWEGKDRAK